MISEKPEYLYYTPEIYGIMDNNRKPFLVFVYPNGKAIVYKNEMDNITKILEIDFKNVFIEKDCYVEEDPEMEKIWGYNEENFDGNSILFEIKEQEYIFVGKTIYYFNTKPNKDKIVLNLFQIWVPTEFHILLHTEKKMFILC